MRILTPGKRLKSFVHGDVFVVTGSRKSLAWFKDKLEQRLAIKSTMIGLGEGEEREGRVLNRIIRVDKDGREYEADQRHAEILIDSVG